MDYMASSVYPVYICNSTVIIQVGRPCKCIGGDAIIRRVRISNPRYSTCIHDNILGKFKLVN